MIKKLRIKITMILMIILTVVLGGILITLNITNYSVSMGMANRALDAIHFRISDMPPARIQERRNFIENGKRPEELYPYYAVVFDENWSIRAALDNKGEISAEDINNEEIKSVIERAEEIFSLETSRGKMGSIIYKTERIGSNTQVILLDNSIVRNNVRNMVIMSAIFGMLGIGIIFIVSVILARWITRPVKETFEKQQNFISDASHELKTPLAVIKANVYTLKDDIGKNKWLEYIESETEHMNSLVTNLLELTRAEHDGERQTFIKFDLTDIIEQSAMLFESIAFENGIRMNTRLDKGIELTGNKEQIKQLMSVLIDNAIKHTYKDGFINISLYTNKNKIYIEVANMGDEIPKEDIAKIFDRFYRVSKSRKHSEGRYGLGLAIAKSIVDTHNGHINVLCEKGWTKFIVIF